MKTLDILVWYGLPMFFNGIFYLIFQYCTELNNPAIMQKYSVKVKDIIFMLFTTFVPGVNAFYTIAFVITLSGVALSKIVKFFKASGSIKSFLNKDVCKPTIPIQNLFPKRTD